MKLLKLALETQNYDLAARVLVYGILKTMVKRIEEEKRRTERQPERPEARILQPGT
jgi:hypothetical protein